MHRKRSSSGWARLAAWLDAPSTRSSSVAVQFNHPPWFAISVLTLILAWVSRIHIRQLRSIRRSLNVDSSHALVRALILTRLDYCNGLLGGAPKCLLSPLSRVLRAAARLILLLPCTSSVENEIRTVLHWLDVPARVTFKLCLLAHRCLHGSAPPYLIRYFTPVSSIAGRSHTSRARCLCLDRGRRQLDLGRSPSPLRLHGTVYRLICGIPGSVFWLSDVDSRLICSILLVNYLLSCSLDSYICIVLVCELLRGFCDNF